MQWASGTGAVQFHWRLLQWCARFVRVADRMPVADYWLPYDTLSEYALPQQCYLMCACWGGHTSGTRSAPVTCLQHP
jgi:hypothetical protein